jgi:hypothetical protein
VDISGRNERQVPTPATRPIPRGRPCYRKWSIDRVNNVHDAVGKPCLAC